MQTIVAYPAFKNRRTNPYQALLYDALQEQGWRVLDLDDALRRFVRPDICHLHWPDGFALHRGLVKSFVRCLFLLSLMRIYRLLGARIVWTVHNLRSHEQFHPRLEAWFWERFFMCLDGWIALNKATVTQIGSQNPFARLPRAVIPHGLYPVVHDTAIEGGSPGQELPHLLLLGKLRSYKEIPSLVTAFAALPEGTARLTIAGQCHEPELATLLREKANSVPGLNISLEYLQADALARLVRSATALLIPYAGSLNSGVLFQALAYVKPVLTPDTPVFREVAEDFPDGMVRHFQAPITSEDLARFVELLASDPQFDLVPVPESYSWTHIAGKHDQFFRKLKAEPK